MRETLYTFLENTPGATLRAVASHLYGSDKPANLNRARSLVRPCQQDKQILRTETGGLKLATPLAAPHPSRAVEVLVPVSKLEVRALRRWLGLSIAVLAPLLGSTPRALRRKETMQLQDPTPLDDHLRMLSVLKEKGLSPEAILNIATGARGAYMTRLYALAYLTK